jgi:hypothetical protein
MRAALVLGFAGLLAATGCDDKDLRRHAQSVVFDLTTREFTCLREFKSDLDGVHVEYVERVRSAGDGKNIVVELVSMNGKKLAQITDPVEKQALVDLADTLAVAAARAIFQRDPHIESIDRMASNYFITLFEAASRSVRGEPSLTFKIEPRVQDWPFTSTVSTTVDRGFPLECQEAPTAHRPVLVSDMRIGSAISGATAAGRWSRGAADRGASASPRLPGARPRAGRVTLMLPKQGMLPYGFQPAKVEQVTFSSTANARPAERPRCSASPTATASSASTSSSTCRSTRSPTPTRRRARTTS